MKQIAYTDILNVVRFFLNLYRLQLGANKQDRAEFKFIEPQHTSPDHTYELRVNHESAWATKRITIRPLGEESSSKSKCFKVTYDRNIVLKIPPQPITDYANYIEAVATERKVAAILSPEIETIAPSISAFLEQIPYFTESSELPIEELERRSVKWLKRFSIFHEYLKIGGSFVFFMDLSKHMFLSHAIEHMHAAAQLGQEIQKETEAQAEVLWDFVRFEGRYGIDQTSVFLKMSGVYSEYERKVTLLCTHYKLDITIPAYKQKKWFSTHLAGGHVLRDKQVGSSDFFADLNVLIKNILEENRSTIASYRQCLRDFLHQKMFAQNKAAIEGLSGRILDLLARLNEKGVAIRDLKPDNLFVVQRHDHATLHLDSADTYGLGLIDFETAVSLDRRDRQEIAQPRLGGTPSYATPSHFAVNPLLRYAYGDVPQTLILQDWQAAISMIFFLATGENLFEQTKNLLPEIQKILQNAIESQKSVYGLFRHYSQIYWRNAAREFSAKIDQHRQSLKVVRIPISKKVKWMLQNALMEEMKAIDKELEPRLSLFPNFRPVDRQAVQIKTLLTILQKNKDRLQTMVNQRPELRQRIIKISQLIDELSMLYGRSQKNDHTLQHLAHRDASLSAMELLDTMFNRVIRSMCTEKWGSPLSAPLQDPKNEPDDDSYEATL